jgi:hypothetical protein
MGSGFAEEIDVDFPSTAGWWNGCVALSELLEEAIPRAD